MIIIIKPSVFSDHILNYKSYAPLHSYFGWNIKHLNTEIDDRRLHLKIASDPSLFYWEMGASIYFSDNFVFAFLRWSVFCSLKTYIRLRENLLLLYISCTYHEMLH